MLSKPLLIYDGNCGFCRRWIERWRQKTGGRIDYAPSQEIAAQFPQIPKEQFGQSVVLVEPNGTITTGAEAALKCRALAGKDRALYWCYRHLPGFKVISEAFYSLIAGNRSGASRVSDWLWGKNFEPSTYRFSIWLFLRLLGLTYLIAFLSLGVQIRGLVGENGILPVGQLVELVKGRLGSSGFWDFPTLCWFYSGDSFLLFLCHAGAAVSVLLTLGVLQGPLLLLLWICYLSLTTAGQVFYQFQWDNLLLEAGFIALFLAPWKVWTPKPAQTNPSKPARRLCWLLLFKLTFSSGLVKLASGDETWRNLTALNFHYETQPLPTWIGWYMYQLPAWFHKLSTLTMFFVELAVPFFIFLPRRLRHFGAFNLIALQVLITVTGNYGFFNLLSIALCLCLLDDTFWRRNFEMQVPSRIKNNLTLLYLLLYFTVSMTQIAEILVGRHQIPSFLKSLNTGTAPFRTINRYGLFAVMTTTRPEVIIEGTNDEIGWKEYNFKWKAGDLKVPPRFVEPHMPRLDWQMWFAALGSYNTDRWVLNFMGRLLKGSPNVLRLLDKNPFPDSPPHHVRAMMYQYHFTDWETKRRTGNWWKRELVGEYTPVMTLKK